MSKWRTVNKPVVTGQIQKQIISPAFPFPNHLYSPQGLGYRFWMMRSMSFKILVFTMTVLLQTGCVKTTIVNLTPSKLPRNSQGIYRIEAAWESNQKSIRDESIQGFVVIDGNHVPMERVQVVEDRWEVLLPLDQVDEGHTYLLKFDYLYDSFPEAKPDSLRTQPYKLNIVEPNRP